MLAAVIVRFLWLGSDPPLYFTNTGQALLTDPYNVIYHARNMILFGEWDIFDFDRWVVFKYSLSSVFCYIIFLLGGVSRITANVSAVILNTVGIALFVFSFRNVSKKAMTIAAVLLLSNMNLIVYGRYPFLENGLIFLCGLLCFLCSRYHEHNWATVLAGLITALCVISGKLFGAVMLVPVVLVIISGEREMIRRRLLLCLGSFVVSLALLLLLFYGGKVSLLYQYISEQTLGMYGVPEAALSPVAFVRKIFSFGGDSRLFYFAPFFMLLLVMSLAVLVIKKNALRFIRDNKLLLFNMGWFLSGFLLLMAVNYRPLRYQLFLLLPAAGIIASIMSQSEETTPDKRLSALKYVLLFLISWYFTTQAGYIVSYLIDYGTASSNIVWYAFAPAVAVFLLPVVFRSGITGMADYRRGAMAVLVVLSVVMQSVWIVKWADSRTYLLREAGEDLESMVGDDAVVCGPFAQALTIDNELKSFIYMFGLTRRETDLFSRYPITHLAADISNINRAAKDYKDVIGSSYKLADYWLRDIKIDVISLAASMPKRSTHRYVPTPFEMAGYYHSAAKYPDSVFVYLKKHLDVNPRSKAGLRLLSNYYMSAGEVEQGFRVFDRLISYYPDDFSLYFEAGRAHYLFYLNTRSPELLRQSEIYFGQAVERNKYIEADVEAARESLRSLAGK